MKNGKKEFVVLTYEEFGAIQEILKDYQDLLDLREAKKIEKDEPTIGLRDLKTKLGL